MKKKNEYVVEIEVVEAHPDTDTEVNDEVQGDNVVMNRNTVSDLNSTRYNGSEDWTSGVWGTAASVGYFLFSSVVLTFFMNFVHARMPTGVPPLPDIGHELIPKLSPENLGDTTMGIMIATLIIVTAINKNRWRILTRFLIAMGNLYLIRVVSIYVTSLPPTDNHCRTEYKPIENIYWNTLIGLLSLGSKNRHCGDLMFSGHTCMITNVWMAIMINWRGKHPLKILLRVVISALLLITCYLIIATRSHYTGDIWIAFWLTALMHALSPYSYPYTKKKITAFFKRVF